MPIVNGHYRRPQLRNKAINYRDGWFFVTFQVFENKSEFGAIVGERCVLNSLGLAVAKLIETLPAFNPGVVVDRFVVMPNHVHMILKIARGATPPHPENNGATPPRPENNGATTPHPENHGATPPHPENNGATPPHPENHGATPPRPENKLAKIMMKLKSLAAREYRLMKAKGEARDIGSHLWQANYWEKIITSHDQLEAIRAYIENNPKRWSTDRFGPVTTYSLGNLELIKEPLVAFVASQEARAEALVIREWNAGGDAPAPREQGNNAPAPRDAVVISTFTSPQEREVLRRLLAKGRRLIAVYPGGIPAVLPRTLAQSVKAGRSLLLSPVATGSGVNKQRAVWCNEYVIRRAAKIWHGEIKRGGTLESILKETK